MLRRSLFLLFLLGVVCGSTLYGAWAYRKHRFPFDGRVPGLASQQIRNTKGRFLPRSGGGQTGGAVSRLEDLGYQEGSEERRAAVGVTVAEDGAWAGVNLYVSGHGEEAVLMDMQGEVLHRWSYDLGAELPPEANERLRPRFRRAHLYRDGGLLTVYGGHSYLARFDRDSNLLWQRFGGYHHDLDVLEDGTIYAIGSEANVVAQINTKETVIEDFIVVLDPEGEIQQRVSILHALMASEYAPLMQQMPAFGDILHTNTIEVLRARVDGTPEDWIPGRVLISLREMDVVALVDMDEEKVVWAMTGLWDGQHQPTLLDNGNMLVFDNFGSDPFARDKSRVLEFDFAAGRTVWDYQGTAENGFYSETCGSSRRLPNGNTLITESDSGRAFEVTPQGRRVWQFDSPHTAGENGELIATLFEVERYPLDYPAFLQPK